MNSLTIANIYPCTTDKLLPAYQKIMPECGGCHGMKFPVKNSPQYVIRYQMKREMVFP